MTPTFFVGYCPDLYDALQTVAHQELPYEPIDDWPPHARQYNESDRQILMDKLIRALGNDNEDSCLNKELEHYLIQLVDAITDCELKEMILTGMIQELMIDNRGFYLAKQR